MSTYTVSKHWPIPLTLSPEFKRSIRQFFLRVPNVAQIDTLVRTIIVDVLDCQERDGVSVEIRANELTQYSEAMCAQAVTKQQKELIRRRFDYEMQELGLPF